MVGEEEQNPLREVALRRAGQNLRVELLDVVGCEHIGTLQGR